MERTTVGLLGAVAGLAALGSAHAATAPAPDPVEVLQASSYADLLAPIPNAAALLRADDAARAQKSAADSLGGIEVAQGYYYNPYYYNPYYYYNRPYPYYRQYYRRYYRRRHHHHHHHRVSFIGVPGVSGVVVDQS